MRSSSRCLLVGAGRVRQSIESALNDAGFTTKPVDDVSGAVAALEREPFIAILASHEIGAALSHLVRCARHRHPEVPVIVLGTTLTVDEAVDAMRRGANDYLPPPFDPGVLRLRLRRVVEQDRDREAEAARPKASELPGLVGTSEAMARLYTTIDKVTRYKTNILLLGESGTGKELIARALHGRGPRRQNLFVPLNCATLTRDLLENELFGHERGAYTGANERKKGLFELADGGTLFLDEIAEMDPSTQAKLLRVLERNEFRRVGGTDKVKVDLSVIAATNRNLPDLIRSGRFREDLYYRLKVVTLVVPPLRERKEDIPALIDFFIADFNRRNGGKIKSISPQLLLRFMAHDWPGNVRELKNAVESAAIMALGPTIDSDALDTPLAPTRVPAPATPVRAASALPDSADELRFPVTARLADIERQVILAQVYRCSTKREAAQALGMGLRTLYTKLRQYGIDPR